MKPRIVTGLIFLPSKCASVRRVMAAESSSAPRPSLPTRLMALPPLSDAYDLAVHFYRRSKDLRVVGCAVSLAEGTVRVAVGAAAPLASPLLSHLDVLHSVDEWACGRLDAVEKMVPCITRPTSEVLSAARECVLGAVGGGDGPTPPTLYAAISSRTSRTIMQAESTKAGQSAADATHQLLDGAHSLVDRCLPEGEGDLHDSDGRDGGVTVKATALATKSSRRLRRTAHQRLHPACPADPTPTHLMECLQTAAWAWLQDPGTESQPDRIAVVLKASLRAVVDVVLRLLLLLQALSQRLAQQKLCIKEMTAWRSRTK